jgi:O-antigen ligase
MVSAVGALCLLTYLGFACLITDAVTERQMIVTLVWGLAAYCVVGWLVAAILPKIGFDGTDPSIALRFQGVSGHPNLMARQTAVFLCLVIGAYSSGYIQRSFLPMLGLGACTLLATQSRTAILGFGFGLIILRKKGLTMVLGGGLLVAASVLLTGGSFATLFAALNRNDEAAETLTGRDEIWDYAWRQIKLQPLLGYGYNSFESNSQADELAPEFAPPYVHPHNNYLSMLYSGGVFSFIPFMTAIWLWSRRWFKDPDTLRDLFMLNMLIGSFTEVDIGGNAGLPMMVLFVVLARDAKRYLGYGAWDVPLLSRST